jgi:small subunit ribosomal protein S15
MALTTAVKAEIVKTHKRSPSDTGSPEVQIALLSASIQKLTEHLKRFNKDFHTRRGLTNQVSQRRRLLRYLKDKDMDRYKALIKTLEIRG